MLHEALPATICKTRASIDKIAGVERANTWAFPEETASATAVAEAVAVAEVGPDGTPVLAVAVADAEAPADGPAPFVLIASELVLCEPTVHASSAKQGHQRTTLEMLRVVFIRTPMLLPEVSTRHNDSHLLELN